MADDWAERRTALREGGKFRVLRDAPGVPDGPPFKLGEKVTLRTVGYSHYDSSHVYAFEGEDRVHKSYWLHDDEPLERLTSTFES